LALSLLARLQAASRIGVKPKERRLGYGLPATPGEVDEILQQLRRAGYVARVFGGRWVLARDLDAVTLDDLVAVLHLGLAPGADWDPAAQRAVEALAAAAAGQMASRLGEIVKDVRKPDAARS
jgi:DNA-binding IscR family transcriptional regulator